MLILNLTDLVSSECLNKSCCTGAQLNEKSGECLLTIDFQYSSILMPNIHITIYVQGNQFKLDIFE